MTDTDKTNADNTGGAHVIEVEAQRSDEPSPSPAQPKSGVSTSEDKPSGGGFVWLLVIIIVIAGSGYATWPYLGPKAEPYLKDARAMLGLQSRPTQPSLPSAPVEESVAPAPLAAAPREVFEATPVETPVQAPAPVFAPQPDATQSMTEAASDLPPAPMPVPASVTETFTAPANPMAVDLERRIAQLESSAAPDDLPILNSLTSRLDVLEAQLNAVARSDNASAGADVTSQLAHMLDELKAEIAALNTRLGAMENTPRGLVDPSASAQALVLSVSQLQSQVASAGPFTAQLEALAIIGGSDPVVGTAVSRLRTYADQGAPSVSMLLAGFKTMAAEVMQVHGRSNQSGWLSEMTDAVTGLVSVRRTDPARIDDPVERALAIAEQALAQNDLKTAVAALNVLSGVEADAAEPWYSAAMARVEVQDALDVLHNHAVAALAATGGA